MANTLTRIQKVIKNRKGGDPSKSYVAKIFSKGRLKIAQKFGEESVEAIIAALSEDDEALIGEAADALFHLQIMLVERGISISDVLDELERREGKSGLDEKASRKN